MKVQVNYEDTDVSQVLGSIIKHENKVLSVYGHQQAILVTEGQTVQAGQTIGTMGSSGSDEVKLLFEIRKEGESIDPIRFLKNIS